MMKRLLISALVCLLQTSLVAADVVQNIKNSETFHRYLALTFTYNFDAKAKKNNNFGKLMKKSDA